MDMDMSKANFKFKKGITFKNLIEIYQIISKYYKVAMVKPRPFSVFCPDIKKSMSQSDEWRYT
jgi:hypothetical protein